jgi:hypothetical protein
MTETQPFNAKTLATDCPTWRYGNHSVVDGCAEPLEYSTVTGDAAWRREFGVAVAPGLLVGAGRQIIDGQLVINLHIDGVDKHGKPRDFDMALTLVEARYLAEVINVKSEAGE